MAGEDELGALVFGKLRRSVEFVPARERTRPGHRSHLFARAGRVDIVDKHPQVLFGAQGGQNRDVDALHVVRLDVVEQLGEIEGPALVRPAKESGP